MRIREARIDEAPGLSALAMRSKAHWDYDEEFLRSCADLLRVREDYLASSPVFVAERDESVLGFYGLSGEQPVAELEFLFVEPGAIGAGVGATLFAHAVHTAAAAGFVELHIESDPNAEGFYVRMGAERTGEALSGAGGRSLPALRLTLV